jgi:hypothetical protein
MKSRRMRRAGNVTSLGEGKCVRDFDEKTHRHRWEDDTKLNLKEICWLGMKNANLTQDTEKWWAIWEND